MLVTVKAKKLVLGRTVYHKGDVFDCRDAEAKLLKAAGQLEKDPPKDGTKNVKESPKPPRTGISVTGKSTGSIKPERAHKATPEEIEANRRQTESQADALARTVAAAKEHNARREVDKDKTTEQEKGHSKPVGAMTMPEGGAVVTGRPVAGAPATATPVLATNQSLTPTPAKKD